MRHGILAERSFDPSIAVETSSGTSLGHLFPTARFIAADDIRFDSVADRASQCVQGDLVVYRIGKDDPVRLVADAMARGACGILTEQLLPCPLPQCIVGDIEVALATINAERLERPDRKLLTIGVTGSAGKTTTALLVASLLRSSGYRAAFQTDLGDCDGIVQNASNKPLPNHSDLIRWIGDAVDTGAQAAIIELSEDQVRYGGYDAIEFDVLVVAGGSDRHTDFGPTAIQCAIDCLTPDGIVVLPAEDQKTLQLVRDADAKPLTYSTRKRADVTAKIVDQSGGVSSLMVAHQNTSAMMETSLCGLANAENHLAATLIGLLLGHRIEQIVEHLGKVRDLPGRGQRIVEYGHPTVVVEAGGSPERAKASLRTERSMKAGGRVWCVLAIDGRDPAVSLSQYGTVLEKYANQPIVTSTLSGKSAFMSASHCVLDGVKDCAAIRLVADRQRAIEWALSGASANDTVLILIGEKNQTACQQRGDVQQIVEFVKATRQPEVEQPVSLKVFK